MKEFIIQYQSKPNELPDLITKMELHPNTQVSDGHHTFDELYDHRNLLFINLCLRRPEASAWMPHYEGWVLLRTEIGILESPGVRQISYHVPEKYLPLFAEHIERDDNLLSTFDGHSSQDVLKRIESNCKILG